MEEYIAFDSHKRYTWVEHEQAVGGKVRQYRIEHAPGAIRRALSGCAPGTPVAIEATANWYWITDEIEQAGLQPLLVHPRKRARAEWEQRLAPLPEQTRWTIRQMLEQLDHVSTQIEAFEQRLKELVEVTPEMQRLMSLPGVGVILAATIALEMGEVSRFASAERLASYAGTVPRVHASGDRVRYGRTRPDVNRYLKWAFAEAGNSVAVNHRRWPERHVSQLYLRLRARKGHNKTVGAVARHLSEAAFHVLSRQQEYRDPATVGGRTREA